MKKIILSSLLAATMMLAGPATAQDSVYTPGTYWVVQGITVEDGQLENYMDYIAATYRKSQDFAKQNGWISGYTILQNVNRRLDEPHLYLVTEMPRLATPQEEVERERKLNEHMQQTSRQATEQSGQRVAMRKLGNNLLLQELDLRAAR